MSSPRTNSRRRFLTGCPGGRLPQHNSPTTPASATGCMLRGSSPDGPAGHGSSEASIRSPCRYCLPLVLSTSGKNCLLRTVRLIFGLLVCWPIRDCCDEGRNPSGILRNGSSMWLWQYVHDSEYSQGTEGRHLQPMSSLLYRQTKVRRYGGSDREVSEQVCCRQLCQSPATQKEKASQTCG